MSGFISTAYAAAPVAAGVAGHPQQGSMLGSFLFLGAFFVIMYLLLWRPQSKRAKEHRDLIAGVGKGDEVITNGGIVGKVLKVTEQFVTLSVDENVSINLQKQSVVSVLPKGTIKEITK